MNLNKYIATAGIASRRKTADLIKEGLVRVNGHKIVNPSFQVPDAARVQVGKRLIHQAMKKYIVLNKPRNYVTTTVDERGRRTVLDLLGNEFKERLYPVGRLDRETTGLLLLTNDGDLAYTVSHPRYHMKKRYELLLNKPLIPEDLGRIKQGIRLPDGLIKIDLIRPLSSSRTNCRFQIMLHSGRYRIIRRLFEYLDYNVEQLDRVAIGNLTKRGLPLGSWRFLTKKELAELTTQINKK